MTKLEQRDQVQTSLNNHQWLVQGVSFVSGSLFTIAAIIGLQMLEVL